MKNNKTPIELYQLLQNITQYIISWAKPGMRVSDVDARAREMLGDYAPYFTHSLGHGVGIQIHEMPGISAKSDTILEPGMIITIEPGVYGIPMKDEEGRTKNEKVYGLRYEEMVLVDKEKLIVL